MSGIALPGPRTEVQWRGGMVRPYAECVLAPNASAYTLDGTNTWILGGSGASIVVDPGPNDRLHRAAIMNRCEERDLTVQAIVVTHGHADHSEGARALAEELRVPVHAVDPQWRMNGANPIVVETLPLDFHDVVVVATPGHTSDSISLVIGDCVLTGDTVLGRGTAMVAHPDGDLRAYLASLDRIQELCESEEIAELLPGHGPTLMDPVAVVRGYREHREARINHVRDAVAAGARTPREIVEIVYADVSEDVWPAAEATVRACLDVLRQG